MKVKIRMKKINLADPNQRKNLLAEIISWVFNPGILGMIILLVAVCRSPMNLNARTGWLITVFILDIFIPFCFYLFSLKRGYIFDGPFTNKSIQRNRIIIFLVFIIIISLQILFLLFFKSYQPLLMILTGGLLAVIVALVITYFFKISMHSGMVTIFALMLIYLYGLEKAWPVFISIPLVFWARMILTRHTFWQLLIGVSGAIIVVFITLLLYGIV